jgi:hypothetical protein
MEQFSKNIKCFPLTENGCLSQRMYSDSPLCNLVGRDNSVSIVTRYGLEGPGIESQWRDGIFRPRPDQAYYTVVTGPFPWVKMPGRSFDHPPLSSPIVKERIELCLFSPTVPSWSVLGWTVPVLSLYHPWQRTLRTASCLFNNWDRDFKCCTINDVVKVTL